MTIYAIMSMSILFLAYMAISLEHAVINDDVINQMVKSVKRRYFLEGVALYVSSYVKRQKIDDGHVCTLMYQEHELHVEVRDQDKYTTLHVTAKGPEHIVNVRWQIEKYADILYVKHLEGVE